MALLHVLIPEQRPTYAIPPGFGFHRLSLPELKERQTLLGTVQIFELPRKGHRYVMGVDASDGLGKDRAAVEVLRVGTLTEPEEQVAQFLCDQTDAKTLAYVVDAIGHLYTWPDGRAAMATIEINNHGMSTQDVLQLHLGYTHFYLWEVVDEADPGKRFTSRIGWQTTPKTRPMLLSAFRDAITNVDPLTGYSDLRVNSVFTIDELRDFQTQEGLGQAEAGPGAHDDSLMALAVAHITAWRLMGGELEPLADRRKRRQEEELRRRSQGQIVKADYRNSDATADDQRTAGTPTVEEVDSEHDELWYDPTGRSFV